MKILPLIAIALLFSSPATSFAYDNYKVLGNYKELKILVEGVRENSVGVTEKKLERTLKLRLMKNGIKPTTDPSSKHFLYLTVLILDEKGGYSASVEVSLRKYSRDYVSPDHGAAGDHLPYSFVSGAVHGLVGGSSKSHLLEAIEGYIDDFILAYLEANME